MHDPTPKIVAIFDLDGTLYTGHVARGLARHHTTHRVKRLMLYTYFALHMALWFLGSLVRASELSLRRIWAKNMGWMVRGWTPEQAAQAFTWIAEHYLRPLVRQDVLARVRQHQQAGHRTILVSGTPAPLLHAIGQELGIEETVGTPLVLRRGRYSGASELPICQGPGKVARLESYLQGEDPIDWSKSYTYADSMIDLPILELAGNAVAVYPDEQLREHAVVLGWEVLD
ncbi:MAG: HAD-IB family hydrolase [Anaerolineales bacterium]|jgi:HAD superfamily hydrolase (TIGR01490 family)